MQFALLHKKCLNRTTIKTMNLYRLRNVIGKKKTKLITNGLFTYNLPTALND